MIVVLVVIPADGFEPAARIGDRVFGPQTADEALEPANGRVRPDGRPAPAERMLQIEDAALDAEQRELELKVRNVIPLDLAHQIDDRVLAGESVSAQVDEFETLAAVAHQAIAARHSDGRRAASRPAIAERPIARIASSVLPPMCGVAMKLRLFSNSTLSGGSVANTSNAAPARRSSASASASAASSISPPRAVLIRTASCFIAAIRARLM